MKSARFSIACAIATALLLPGCTSQQPVNWPSPLKPKKQEIAPAEIPAAPEPASPQKARPALTVEATPTSPAVHGGAETECERTAGKEREGTGEYHPDLRPGMPANPDQAGLRHHPETEFHHGSRGGQPNRPGDPQNRSADPEPGSAVAYNGTVPAYNYVVGNSGGYANYLRVQNATGSAARLIVSVRTDAGAVTSGTLDTGLAAGAAKLYTLSDINTATGAGLNTANDRATVSILSTAGITGQNLLGNPDGSVVELGCTRIDGFRSDNSC